MRRRAETALFTGTLTALLGAGACNLVNGVDQYTLAGGAGGSTTTTTTLPGGGGAGGVTSPPSRVQWSRSFGGPDTDAVTDIAMRNAQAVITGYVSGPAQLGSIDTMDPGVFVATLKSDGATSDAVVYPTGPGSGDAPPAIALLPGGDRVLAGVFTGVVDFGAGEIMAADTKLFVSTLGATADKPFSLAIGQAVKWSGPRLVGDAAGGVAVFVDGSGGTVTFGNKDYMGTPNNTAYLLRTGPGGVASWSRAFVADQNIHAHNIAIDPTDDLSVFIAGVADAGPVDFGCAAGPLDVLGYGMFVVRIDAMGSCTQQWSYGDSTPPSGLAVDSKGGVVVGGTHEGAFEVQGKVLDAPTGVTNLDAYLLRFDAAGKLVWGRTFGATNYNDDVDEIVIGQGNDVFVTGHVGGPVDLGDGVTLEASTSSDLYVARFSSVDGKALWAQRFPNKTALASVPSRLAVDVFKDLLVAGPYAEMIDFGDADSPHLSKGGQDGYVVKLSPD